jgi:hypothetical protein
MRTLEQQMSETLTEAVRSTDAPSAQYVLETLGVVFSTVVISGINIIISGHLLGYVLNFGEGGSPSSHDVTPGKNNIFQIWFPWLLRLGITGNHVIAGFASFTISLLVVGIFLPRQARQIFIDNLQATDSQWIACQSLAAGLAVFVCVLLSGCRLICLFVGARSAAKRAILQEPSLRERADKLVK